MIGYLIVRLQRLKWPIRTKIGMAFALVLFFFIVNGLISIFLLFNIQQAGAQQKAYAVYLEELQRYELAYTNEVNAFSDTIFVTRLNYVRDSFRTIIVQGLLEKAAPNISETNLNYRNGFADLYKNAFEKLSALEQDIQSGKADQAKAEWLDARPDIVKVSDWLAQWQKYLESERDAQEKALGDTIFLSVVTIVSLTLVSIIVALGMLSLIGRVLVNPLNSLQQALQQMAGGNLDQQIEIFNQDEIGKLAQSFKQAQYSLQQVIGGLRIGESLHAVTGQLTSVSQQQASGTVQQVSALSQVGASMQELGRTASQIAESAAQVATLTGATVQQIEQVAEAGLASQNQAHKMTSVVENTLNGVERVGQQVNEFSRVMVELNQQAEAIGKVVTLLGSIAGEVHLLALNAAIEASGAGEYGERFRMVAREVKQLANRANRATEEARTLVNGVQISSREALNQVTQGQTEIWTVIEANSGLRQSLETMVKSAHQVNDSVTSLMNLAGQVSQQAEEIKLTAQQQRQANEQVIFSAHSVRQVAEQTADATHLIASSSLQLENLTDQLNNLLGQVRLAT